MKLRLNGAVNPDIRRAGHKLMKGAPWEINQPNTTQADYQSRNSFFEASQTTHTKYRAHDTWNRARCSATWSKQNRRHCWYGRSRDFAVHCVTLTPVFEVFFNNKDNCRKKSVVDSCMSKIRRIAGYMDDKTGATDRWPGGVVFINFTATSQI